MVAGGEGERLYINGPNRLGRGLGLAGAEGGEGHVGRLLARDEHGAEGRAHAGRGILHGEEGQSTVIRP